MKRPRRDAKFGCQSTPESLFGYAGLLKLFRSQLSLIHPRIFNDSRRNWLLPSRRCSGELYLRGDCSAPPGRMITNFGSHERDLELYWAGGD